MRATSKAAWTQLSEPWQQAFELAWESYRADTVPVGAVIIDGGGRVVATGSNSIHATSRVGQRLLGSRLAHAELNALLELPLEPTSPLDVGLGRGTRVAAAPAAVAEPGVVSRSVRWRPPISSCWWRGC
jgi:hypothetical protein